MEKTRTDIICRTFFVRRSKTLPQYANGSSCCAHFITAIRLNRSASVSQSMAVQGSGDSVCGTKKKELSASSSAVVSTAYRLQSGRRRKERHAVCLLRETALLYLLELRFIVAQKVAFGKRCEAFFCSTGRIGIGGKENENAYFAPRRIKYREALAEKRKNL